MPLSSRCHISLLLTAATALGQEPEVRQRTGIHPFETGPIEQGKEKWHACRAIDAITGNPIAGAELLLVAESNTPVGGKFTWLRKVNSDAEGFAALPVGGLKGEWLFLRAPGYGPSANMNAVASLVWPLQPALDVPVQILDWLGRPVPGARVGLCLGCGHTPDVANATADARGIAVVRGIDPDNGIADFYPQHPDLGIDHYDGVEWSPGDPPAFVKATYAVPVRGVVLDPDGKPVGNAFVGTKNMHRGPWTSTRADGTFQVDGSPPEDDLFVVVADRPDHEYLFELPWERPVTLRLPVRSEDPCQVVNLARPQGRNGELQLRLEDTTGPLDQLVIELSGPLPMRHRHSETTGEDGTAAFELATGEYEVRCRSRSFEDHVGTVTVTAGESKRTLRPRPLPTVRLDAPKDCTVAVMRRGQSFDVTDLVAKELPVPVPANEVFGFAIESKGDRRIVPFPAGAVQKDQIVRLRFLPLTQVRASLVDGAGKAVAATVALLQRQEFLRSDEPFDVRKFTGTAVADGMVDLTDTRAGMHVLAVRPGRADLRPLVLAVSLPHRGEGAVLDLGVVTVPAVPRLRVTDAAGRAWAGAPPGLMRLGLHDVREKPRPTPLDEQGSWLGLEPQPGDAIVVPAAHWDLGAEPDAEGVVAIDVPFRTVLEGSAPWTITVPDGALRVHVTDAGGKDVTAVLFIADRSIRVHGPVLLRQLPAGDLIVIAASAGRKAAEARVRIRRGEPATLRIALQPE